jgi:hypothetical protein
MRERRENTRPSGWKADHRKMGMEVRELLKLQQYQLFPHFEDEGWEGELLEMILCLIQFNGIM